MTSNLEIKMFTDTFTKPAREAKRGDRKPKPHGDEQRTQRLQRHQRRERVAQIRERELTTGYLF